MINCEHRGGYAPWKIYSRHRHLMNGLVCWLLNSHLPDTEPSHERRDVAGPATSLRTSLRTNGVPFCLCLACSVRSLTGVVDMSATSGHLQMRMLRSQASQTGFRSSHLFFRNLQEMHPALEYFARLSPRAIITEAAGLRGIT
jgi:hypothetical protein